MKIKGRHDDAWHKNIKDTAGPRKPLDPDFPWAALQNHTGYYMKKKGKISQHQIDECLLALIHNHASKDVAIAACAPHVSVRAIRDLVANFLKTKPNTATEFSEYLQIVVLTKHVYPGSVSEIEARWAQCLWKHTRAYRTSGTLGDELRDMLPLLLARVDPNLLLQAEITALASDVCLDFRVQLEQLKHENQWMDAHTAAGWLTKVPNSNMLREPNTGAGQLLDSHLPTWGAWAAWRPHITRIRTWQKYAILASSSLKDLFALEGPDFVSEPGSEHATLREYLITQGSRGSQSTVYWQDSRIGFTRNPFKQLENLTRIFERLTNVIDYGCSARPEYTYLLTHLCVGKIINNEAIQILEGAQTLDNSAITVVILRTFTLPAQQLSEEISGIIQLLPAIGDTRVRGLREQMVPHLVNPISSHFQELRNGFLACIATAHPWISAATNIVNFVEGLKNAAWLANELHPYIQQAIAFMPSLTTIQTLSSVRDAVQRTSSRGTGPLLSQIDAYCKAQLIPDFAIASQTGKMIEAITYIWQQDIDEDRRELALVIAELPSANFPLRYECLYDLATLDNFRATSILEALNIPNGNPNRGCFTLIRLLASEERMDFLGRWRQVLRFAVEKQHERLFDYATTHLSAEGWFDLLGSLRAVYKDSEAITQRNPFTLFSLELHTWSQQLAFHLPTLTRLESMPGHENTIQMLLSGSDNLTNGQHLRVLQLVEDCESTSLGKLMDSVLVLLDGRNADEVEDVLLTLSRAKCKGIKACLSLLDARGQVNPGILDVVLATKLRAADISEQDRMALKKVARLFGIYTDAEGNPSTAGLKEATNSLHERYLELITRAQRLENLRLSLKAVASQSVSDILLKLRIEAPPIVEDMLASLPPTLNSLVEKVSGDQVELQFPATNLTKLQRFAIGAGDAESFIIRLTLRDDGVPSKFCVHLSSELSSSRKAHSPWEVFRGGRAPHEQYCHGRPNRGVFQLSRIMWAHLRHNFKSLEQTHSHITAKLSKFGQGCLVCGQGQHRLRRATICPLQSCQKTVSQAHIEIQLAEIWQDPPVLDLLLTSIHAVAKTGKLDLLTNCPTDNASAVVSMLDQLPAIPSLATHLTSCLNVHGNSFSLAQSLAGYCDLRPFNPSSNSNALAFGLLWASMSYRGFLVSTTGTQRIPSFGNNQFLLANTAPDLEVAFSRHMPSPASESQILFHGTSLDRLHPILCQGLRVQSGTALERNGAIYGSGIYMADEPRVAWRYATTSKGGWKSSNLKNMKVLLGCELAGSKPRASFSGIYVITDATKLAVRYIFLLGSNAMMPAAKDVRLPMGSVFQGLRNGTL